MIDISREQLLTFSEACNYLPRRRRGRKAHPSTIWRWATRGLRSVKLEVIRIGGVAYTSREAIQRFANRLSGGFLPSEKKQGRGDRRLDLVEAELTSEGI